MVHAEDFFGLAIEDMPKIEDILGMPVDAK